MPVGSEGAAVQPGVRNGGDHLLVIAAEDPGGQGGARHPNQNDVIDAESVKCIFQRDYTLNFVCFDQCIENHLHLQWLIRRTAATPAFIVRRGENGAKIVRRVAPLCSQPGVLKIQPAHTGPDVECRGDGIELVTGSRYPRAAFQACAGDHRPQGASALWIFEGVECAAQGIHQCQAGRRPGLVTVDLKIEHILGDVAKCCIDRWTRRVSDMVILHHIGAIRRLRSQAP